MGTRSAAALTVYLLGVAVGIGRAQAQAPAEPIPEVPEVPDVPQVPSVDVTWIAPAECPDEASLHAAIAWMLGHPLEADVTEPFSASAVVEPISGGYRVLIETRSHSGEGRRALQAATCVELADATAVILALAINPALEMPTSAPPAAEPPEPVPPEPTSPEPTSPEPTPPPEPPSEPDAPSLDRSATTGARWALGLGAVLDTNVITVPTFGLESELALTIGNVRASLRIGFHPPHHRTASGGSLAQGGAVMLGTAGLRACRPFRPSRRTSLGPCVGLAAGFSRARGYGVTEPSTALAPWLALDGGARGTVALTPGAARGGGGPTLAAVAALSVDAVVPLLRSTYFLENIGDVYRPPPISVRIALTLELQFP
jgi:hypothetical protein